MLSPYSDPGQKPLSLHFQNEFYLENFHRQYQKLIHKARL